MIACVDPSGEAGENPLNLHSKNPSKIFKLLGFASRLFPRRKQSRVCGYLHIFSGDSDLGILHRSIIAPRSEVVEEIWGNNANCFKISLLPPARDVPSEQKGEFSFVNSTTHSPDLHQKILLRSFSRGGR